MANQIGISNLPNQRHKIVQKRGASFTLMVCGESGLGKTTFINTLFATHLKGHMDHRTRHTKQTVRNVEIDITKAELVERDFTLKLTVIDTPGLGDYVNNTGLWDPVVDFIDDQHESYMLQEQQPNRNDRIDMRVHACLYFIRPTGYTLKPLDIEVMKQLSSRVNLIPVIGKADSLPPSDLHQFKQRIRQVLAGQGVKTFTPPMDDVNGQLAENTKSLMEAMPFAVIGSENDVTTPDGRVVKGRKYPWGVSEVENEKHCDFIKLRSVLLRTHMLDLIISTEEEHYENYRAKQLESRRPGEPRQRTLEHPRYKQEEEELRRRFTDQVRVEEQRFRQWEQRLIAERDKLNKDLEAAHQSIKSLESEIESLQMGMSTKSHRGR